MRAQTFVKTKTFGRHSTYSALECQESLCTVFLKLYECFKDSLQTNGWRRERQTVSNSARLMCVTVNGGEEQDVLNGRERQKLMRHGEGDRVANILDLTARKASR